VTKTQDGGLVRCRGHAQINAHKAPQRGRVIERIFHARVRQVEPLLHEIRPQHDLQANRTATITRLGIMRLNQRQQKRPGNNLVHLFEKLLPLAPAAILLKATLPRQRPLKMRLPLHSSILFKLDADRGLVQSFLSHSAAQCSIEVTRRLSPAKKSTNIAATIT